MAAKVQTMVTLEQYVVAEMKRLIKFSSEWRASHKTKQESYPLEYSSTAVWNKHFNAYSAQELEDAIRKEFAEQAKAA